MRALAEHLLHHGSGYAPHCPTPTSMSYSDDTRLLINEYYGHTISGIYADHDTTQGRHQCVNTLQCRFLPVDVQ